MYVAGIGMLYSGSISKPGELICRGTAAICKNNCGMLMFCHYYPTGIYTGPGVYRIAGPYQMLGGIYAFYGGSDGIYNSLTEDSFIQGFAFHL